MRSCTIGDSPVAGRIPSWTQPCFDSSMDHQEIVSIIKGIWLSRFILGASLAAKYMNPYIIACMLYHRVSVTHCAI